MKKKYGCAILAGGEGLRMGHIEKGNLKAGNRTFREILMNELEEIGFPVYYSYRGSIPELPPEWTGVADRDGTGLGPIDGISSCLEKAEDDGLDGLFFVPVDAPCFRAEAIRYLKEVLDKHEKECQEEPDAALWETEDGRIQPTFGYYAVKAFPALDEAVNAKEYSLKNALKHMTTVTASVAAYGIPEQVFTNVNTPEDYEMLLKDTEWWSG